MVGHEPVTGDYESTTYNHTNDTHHGDGHGGHAVLPTPILFIFGACAIGGMFYKIYGHWVSKMS